MASTLDIIIRARDRASGVLKGIGAQLSGVGRALGGGAFGGMLGRGLVFGALAVGARMAARAVRELADEARQSGNFDFITEKDVRTVEHAATALGTVKNAIVGVIAAKAAGFLRAIGIGGDGGPSEVENEKMREEIEKQKQARIATNKLLFDQMATTDQLAASERKLAELKERGRNDAEAMLELTRQQVIVDKLRAQVLQDQLKTQTEAIKEQIEQSKVNEEEMREHARTANIAGFKRGEAVVAGGIAPLLIQREMEDQRDERTKLEEKLRKQARLDPRTAALEARGALRVSRRANQARLALDELNQARNAEAAVQQELDRQKALEQDALRAAMDTAEEIKNMHATIKDRLVIG